jgi:SAM-dependent methyltransferase
MSDFDLGRLPLTDPTEIFRFRDGIYAADLLVAGVCWLDFFTWLAEHPSDLAGICRGLQLKERPADVMVTLFTALGLVRSERGAFRVTEVAGEHLVRSSPWYLGPYLSALKDRAVCKDMLAVLRSGAPASWCSVANDQAWTSKMDDEQFARDFTAAMDARATLLAPALAGQLDCRGYRCLLDVAGGSGIYACAIVAAHPHLKATVLEKPPVDRVARRLVAARGFTDRVGVVGGDMFAEPLPAHCDVHLWSNVLHDWDVPDVRRLLHQSLAALPPGGMLLIHDAHLDATKSGPLPVAMYSALLMHSTEGRCYSIAEMEGFLREAGCVDIGHAATAADRSVVSAKKAA